MPIGSFCAERRIDRKDSQISVLRRDQGIRNIGVGQLDASRRFGWEESIPGAVGALYPRRGVGLPIPWVDLDDHDAGTKTLCVLRRGGTRIRAERRE